MPVLLLLPIANYITDPHHVFQTAYVEQMVKMLQQGNNVTNIALSNYDTRIFKEHFVKLHKGEHYDYLILGSSQTMQFSKDMFGGKTVLNAGVLSATILDVVSLYEMCKENHITADNIIIAPTFYYFNSNNAEEYWMYYQDYLNRFLNEHKRYFYTGNIPMLFDPSGLFKRSTLKPTDKVIDENSTYCTDGSMTYGTKQGSTPQQRVDELAKIMHTKKGEKGKYHNLTVSREYISILQKFINECRRQGIKLIFCKMPFHPLQYQAFMKMKGAPEQSTTIDSIAKANGIEVYGSFNPADLGYKNVDFYDGSHAKRNVSVDVVKALLRGQLAADGNKSH